MCSVHGLAASAFSLSSRSSALILIDLLWYFHHIVSLFMLLPSFLSTPSLSYVFVFIHFPSQVHCFFLNPFFDEVFLSITSSLICLCLHLLDFKQTLSFKSTFMFQSHHCHFLTFSSRPQSCCCHWTCLTFPFAANVFTFLILGFLNYRDNINVKSIFKFRCHWIPQCGSFSVGSIEIPLWMESSPRHIDLKLIFDYFKYQLKHFK